MTRDRIFYELKAQGVTLDFPNACWRYRRDGNDLGFRSLWDLLDELVWVELFLGLRGLTRRDLIPFEVVFGDYGEMKNR